MPEPRPDPGVAEAAYKRHVAGVYERAAPSYGQVGPRFFEAAGRRLVELAGVRAGERVLDMATGRGAVLFPAAERAGPRGRVLGVDIAPAMVEALGGDARERRLGNVDLAVMDAERLALRGAPFDAVLCSFAVFFFARVEQVLSSFAALLRLGGRIGIAQGAPDPRWRWQDELMVQLGAPEPPPSVRGSALRRPGVLRTLIEDAGLGGVREVREEAVFAFRDADEWWRSLWTHGTRSAMEAMDAQALDAFRAAAKPRLRELAREGLTQRMELFYVVGTRPG